MSACHPSQQQAYAKRRAEMEARSRTESPEPIPVPMRVRTQQESVRVPVEDSVAGPSNVPIVVEEGRGATPLGVGGDPIELDEGSGRRSGMSPVSLEEANRRGREGQEEVDSSEEEQNKFLYDRISTHRDSEGFPVVVDRK